VFERKLEQPRRQQRDTDARWSGNPQQRATHLATRLAFVP
jgi:hypothetical protein